MGSQEPAAEDKGLTLDLDHGRHQEEDAGHEGGEGQCHGQVGCL